MDTILIGLVPILNILAIFCIITGLYIAGRLLPTFVTWLHSFFPENLFSHQIPKTILWLALGALFTSPLLDFVSTLGWLINVTLLPQGGGEFTSMLGTVPIADLFYFSAHPHDSGLYDCYYFRY